jgi:spore coat polysaccharide biosynthesis protein SpsF
MSSTRLPGKVMKEICGHPVLWHVYNRLLKSRLIDKIVVATSTDSSDDVIDRWCVSERVRCFRGSLDDVLRRYYWAARAYGAKTVVRITADCPLIDPQVVDTMIETFQTGSYDYVRTDETYPNGLDVEVFSDIALLNAFNEASLPSEREHVTPYIWKNPELFSIARVPCAEDRSPMRWTVDDEKDFRLVEHIFEGLYKPDRVFHMAEILEFLDSNPKLLKINSKTKRNEGYARSLREDGTANA